MIIINKDIFLDIVSSKNNFKKEAYYTQNEFLKKLVFYDADAIAKKYSAYMAKKGDYDVSQLKNLSCLEKGETFAKIVPIEKKWLAVFIKDDDTNNILQNKIMYLSLSGEGYVSDDVQSALDGNVPRDVLLRHIEEDLWCINELDNKYFDGNHDDLLSEIYGKARAILTEFFVSAIKSEDSGILNQDLKTRDDITLEEIRDVIDEEFRRKPRAEDFPIYESFNLVFYNLGCDKVIELSNRYKQGEDLNKNNYTEKQ